MSSLTKQEKIRFIAFAAISLVSVVLVVWFGWGICDLTAAAPIEYDNVGNINIDGADFTGFFLLTAGALNGLFMLIYAAVVLIYALFAAVAAALSSVLLRVLALKKAESVGAAELALTRKIYMAASIIQTVIPVLAAVGYIIAGRGASGLMSLLLCWQYPLFMGLIYIKKLKGLAAGAVISG